MNSIILSYTFLVYFLSKVPLHPLIASTVCRILGINLSSAKKKTWCEYRNFLEIFTREPESICISDAPLVAPCQGQVWSVNEIGKFPSKADLKAILVEGEFEVKSSVGIYLSPRDFHRVYAPVDGFVEKIQTKAGLIMPIKLPLFGPLLPAVYFNKMVKFFVSTNLGRICLIMVGACGVGEIKVSLPSKTGCPVSKGTELGVFELGSFVWVLLEGKLNFKLMTDQNLHIGDPLV
ncbi:MAG: phosphatidylserine decarboxylase [Deltaproteobacteria bacterium]|nr:phosphatidylserine decarboxylase [Deltaproteobacteria bacterium]